MSGEHTYHLNGFLHWTEWIEESKNLRYKSKANEKKNTNEWMEKNSEPLNGPNRIKNIKRGWERERKRKRIEQ